jgi:hypothetical protein
MREVSIHEMDLIKEVQDLKKMKKTLIIISVFSSVLFYISVMVGFLIYNDNKILEDKISYYEKYMDGQEVELADYSKQLFDCQEKLEMVTKK